MALNIAHNMVVPYNPELIDADEAFLVTQRTSTPNELIWQWVQQDSAHTNHINLCCFHWRVEGLVLHFCLSIIQMACNMTFNIVHKMAVSYNPGLINPDEAFLTTQIMKSHPKGWLWQGCKEIQLTQTTSIYYVPIGE